MNIFAVLEPQISGSWHLHVLLKRPDGKLPYISNNKTIEPMWGNGFTSLKRVKTKDHIANYLVAYLSDVQVELPPDNNGKTSKKAVIKGERLHFYPTGVNIFRRSRGIKNPEKIKASKKEVLDQLNLPENLEADFSSYYTKEISSGRKISITTEIYNDISKDDRHE